MCESLGLDATRQRKRLTSPENIDWCEITHMTSVAEDGRLRELTMISHECLPMWLVTISPIRVKQEVREKLSRYRREVSAVIASWFLGTSADRPDIAAELKGVRERLVKVEHYLRTSIDSKHKCHLRNEELEGEVGNLRSKSATIGKCDPDEYWTFRDFSEEFGVEKPISHGEKIRASRALAKLSRELDIEIRKVACSRFGEINSYRIDACNAWCAEKDKADRLEEVRFWRQFDEMGR